MIGEDSRRSGMKINNVVDTGTLTGLYEIDLIGQCWWEVIPDTGMDNFWMVGDRPEGRI